MILRIARPALITVLVTAGAIITGNCLQNVKNGGGEEGDHPGYFQQWFNEKKDANGNIPRWLQASWSAWDKSQINRRSEPVIDSVIQLGPKDVGGRTRSVWIDPRNENIILAAAISGGMWRSENTGSTWTPINDQNASFMSSCIVSNPFNHDEVYYGTGEARANSADVSGNGIYKSNDGGKTFSVLSSTVGKTGFDVVWDIDHNLDQDGLLYAATDATGLWRSRDAGATWEESFFGGNKKATDILVLPKNRVLVSLQSNGVYASDSAGKKGTFTKLTFPGLSSSYLRIQLASCRKYPNVCWALVENTSFSGTPVGFYKSSNGGRTWVSKTLPDKAGSGYQGYCVMLGAHPTDSNSVVAGGVNIAQSTNGGATWTSKTVGHSDNHAFAPYIGKPDEFLVGSDGGVHRFKWSVNSAPLSLNTGYYTTQFYAGNFGMSGLISMSGAQDNGTHVATNKLTSKKFYGADGAYAHIGLQDGSVAYMSTQNDGIRRFDNFNPTNPAGFSSDISNGGTFAADGVDFINAYNMNKADQNMLFYRTAKGWYRSTDGGESWTKLTSSTRAGIKAIGISNDANPVVYFGGSAAQIYKVVNAGTSGVGQEVNMNSTVPVAVTDQFISAITVHPKDKYCIYFSFSNNGSFSHVWRASGMDSSKPVYKDISGNLPPTLPVNMVAVDPAFPDKNFFAATDFGLYYSTDSGKTWTKETRVPNVAIHEIKMRDDRTCFLYTHGRGMWAFTLIPVNGVTRPEKPSQLSVFPNPATGYIQVSLPVIRQNCSYEIYNPAGQKLVQGQISQTENKIQISQLTPGYYFLRVKENGKYSTARFAIRR
ncbi:MAG: T9SS type A sorting domain-containing protein [Bacteroidetes bacterium]|nr:T9SS type A sorting domain-containing protein [Bacteroidota bacterium]